MNNLIKVIVYNRPSREPLIEFFKHVLKCNVKRSNMQVRDDPLNNINSFIKKKKKINLSLNRQTIAW